MSRIGYIKIHRQIMRGKLFKDSVIMHVWLTLLLKASHSSNNWTYNKREYSVKSGELFTCLDTLESDTGISRMKIYRTLNKLKSERMITTKSTPYGTHIKVVKWSKYQLDDNKRTRYLPKSEHIKNDIYKPLKKFKKYI